MMSQQISMWPIHNIWNMYFAISIAIAFQYVGYSNILYMFETFFFVNFSKCHQISNISLKMIAAWYFTFGKGFKFTVCKKCSILKGHFDLHAFLLAAELQNVTDRGIYSCKKVLKNVKICYFSEQGIGAAISICSR